MINNFNLLKTLAVDIVLPSNIPDANPSNVITSGANILLFLTGAIAVLSIIYAGLQFVTSGGDSSKAATARKTILYAIVGVVVATFAKFIVDFVITAT